MSVEANNDYNEIISIIQNNVVFPAKNNNLFTHKAYTVGSVLSIMVDLTARTLSIIRHDGKGKKYDGQIKDEHLIMTIYKTCEDQIKSQNEVLQQEQEKIHNITQHGKTLEQVKYIASRPESVLSIENAPEKHDQSGVAVVKHFIYSTRNTQIQYSKWIVECFDSAKHMQLHGYEKHNKLVQGSGVKFLSHKTKKTCTFYGKEAADIINICESYHMDEILRLTNNLQR